ncbi:MAG: hypothetical protein ACI9HE_001683 [Planctomycetota bacterium]|jgi:hypothetical protein
MLDPMKTIGLCRLLTALPLLGLASCVPSVGGGGNGGGSGGGNGATIDVTGTWLGSWSSSVTDDSGSFMSEFIQGDPIQTTGGPNSPVAGEVNLANSPCVTSADVTATISPGVPFHASPSITGTWTAPSLQIEFTANLLTG